MRGVGLFGMAVISLIAGLIAGVLLNRRFSGPTYMMAGLLGSLLGGFLLRELRLDIAADILQSLAAATLGAVILLGLFSLMRRPSK
jgi:uncharacterized membrane protein YeaQ/YmgE (transglycosylase-associated protein family)